MMMDTKFLAMQVDDGGDEAYGTDRPAALVLRVGDALRARVAAAVDLMQQQNWVTLGLCLAPDDIRWIRTVGYAQDNLMQPIAGWMDEPGLQLRTPFLDDVMEMDIDGERADFREDCTLYESTSEPLLGESVVFLQRKPQTEGIFDSQAPFEFFVHGNTKTFQVGSFIYPLADLQDLFPCPSLPAVQTTETDRPVARER
jgi:hypothetical protein